jgi:hypothetical protein
MRRFPEECAEWVTEGCSRMVHKADSCHRIDQMNNDPVRNGDGAGYEIDAYHLNQKLGNCLDELGAVVRKPTWFPREAEEYVELVHATFTSFTFGFIDDMII